MTSTNSAIEIIKNIAVIVTMIATILAILVNWKAIFRPHAKRLEDRQFEAATNLLSALGNPQLQILYYSSSPIEDEIAFKTIQPLLLALSSPFLPERLRVEGERYWQSFAREGGLFWFTGVMGQTGLSIHNKEALFEQHKLVYAAVVEWFNLAPHSFPLMLPPKQNGPQA